MSSPVEGDGPAKSDGPAENGTPGSGHEPARNSSPAGNSTPGSGHEPARNSSPVEKGAPAAQDDAVEGGRPLLRGRLLGFPVHLDLSFVIIMGILGYYPGIKPIDLVLWLVITPVAVLTHELGHAVLARAAGAEPEIALAGFGGVTTFTPPRELSRARSLGISLAGPGVGLLIGLALLAVQSGPGADFVSGSWQHSALEIGIWTCIGWSALNLLPIIPLDGGQAMRELLPGDPAVRARRAAMVSIVAAAIAAAAAYIYTQQLFLTLFLVFFGVSNWLTLRQSASAPSGRAVTASPDDVVIDLLWRGQPARAREALAALPPGASVDLAVHGAVLALTGERDQGHALLVQEVQRRPGDPKAIALMVLTQALEHEWDALIASLQGPAGRNVPPPVIARVIAEARGVGREDVAGRLQILTDRTAG